MDTKQIRGWVRRSATAALVVGMFAVPSLTGLTYDPWLSCKWPILVEKDASGEDMAYYDKACNKAPISVVEFNQSQKDESERQEAERRQQLRERAGL